MATLWRVCRRTESVARMVRFAALLVGIALFHTHGAYGAAEYFGRYIGSLSRLQHSVSGEVYAVDARTLHLRDFIYDGEGPAAFFYAGNSKTVSPGGFFVRDENGSNGVLKKYNKKHITITLPEGKTLHNIKWFSVWCDEFEVNFGDIQIPRGLDFPKPQKIGSLAGVHAVSSDSIVVVDAQTLLIPSFSYDGEAPDAKFWVGRGPKPSPQGIKVPDENGKTVPLRRYDRKTIVLTLPGELTIFDIGHFGVWCEAFTVDFGHIQIPPALNVPPSLKMLGVSPQSKLNCEVLSDDLAYEVRWAVAGDSVVIQLVAKLENGEYMSFGLSGDDSHSEMVGGDVVVAWVDQRSLNGFAQDYYLDAKSQCAGIRGSCPDYKIEPNTESVRLLNAALVNGYSIVTYQRPLKAHDGLDKPILTNHSQPIIWAVGPLNGNQEVSYHAVTSKGDIFIDFGRAPRWNCPIPETDTSDLPSSPHTSDDLVQHESILNSRSPQQMVSTERISYQTPPPPAPAPKKDAWAIPPIQCDEIDDDVLYAQMGPTGGKKGYSAITGHVGWGISYYINGLLIPEIHVVRNRTYTFVVEGGTDPNIPAKFHPFYITDDPVGGYQHKTPEERKKVNIFAGAELNKHGEVVPTGTGRLCNWTPDPNHQSGDEFASFGAYQRTLTLICDYGEPNFIQWTPDQNTPDTVYYQCFSHRYLGWKIHVHDVCDAGHHGAASEPIGSFTSPEGDELLAKPSIVVSTRVKPDFPPQSINDHFKKDSIHDTKETSFADKPSSYSFNQDTRQDVKGKFPYEIYKPSSGELRPNMSEAVIPVIEDVDDQESTTFKMSVVSVNSSVSTNLAGDNSFPLVKSPNNRNPIVPQRGALLQAGQHFGQPPLNRRPVTVMVRRPIQPGLKPNGQHIPMMNRPPQMIHHSPSQPRPIIVKKPIIRVPQRPMGVNHPPPPPSNQRPLLGPTIATYPQPPQPPPMPSRPPKPAYVHKFKKPINSFVTGAPDKNKYKILPSQMISQKPEDSSTRVPIAMNTGFNPGSLVIESGFKPIIASQHAEKRVSEVEYDEEENNEGVINMDSLDEQKSQTEMFEPMFIPSPLDSNVKHVKKATTEPVKKIRKPYRQVVVRRPVYDEPLFRSEPDDEVGETAMANEKTEVYYLPNSKTTVLSYDGKELSNDAAPPIPPNHKPESKSSEQLKKEPQYGPFKGDFPPPVPSYIPDSPQLHLHGEDGMPPSALPLTNLSDSSATQPSNNSQLNQQEFITSASPTIVEDVQEHQTRRKRRDAHHEPGHVGEGNAEHHADHDHSGHDHSTHGNSEHDHSKHMQPQASSAISLLPTVFLLICASIAQF